LRDEAEAIQNMSINDYAHHSFHISWIASQARKDDDGRRLNPLGLIVKCRLCEAQAEAIQNMPINDYIHHSFHIP